jgi:hypothetical protein
MRGILIGLGIAYLLGSEQMAKLRRDLSRTAKTLDSRLRGITLPAESPDDQWDAMATVVIDVDAARAHAQPSY